MEDLVTVFDPQGMFDFPDPYPLFAELRRTNPVTSFQFLNRLSYVVTRYDDVRAVLQDGETYSSRANAEVGRYMGRTLIEMDGGEHGRMRARGRGAPARVFPAAHRPAPPRAARRRHQPARHRDGGRRRADRRRGRELPASAASRGSRDDVSAAREHALRVARRPRTPGARRRRPRSRAVGH